MTHGRDGRIDAFRGLALVFILIDHIPGNVLAGFTLQNLAFADAAEVLVLLAGISAAAGAARRVRNGAASSLVSWSLQRAAKLYLAHIAIVTITLAAFAAAALASRNGALMAVFERDILSVGAAQAVIGLLTLQFQPDYLNILPLYICFIAALPQLMAGVKRAPAATLTASAVLWWITGNTGINLPSTTHATGWYFNPLAWQLLFVVGLVGWTYREQIHTWITSPFVRNVATVVAIAALCAKAPWAQLPAFAHLQFDMGWLVDPASKTILALPRLINILALAVLVYSVVPASSKWLERRAGSWLGLLGRHALPVYLTSALFDAFTTVSRLAGARGAIYQVIANSLGLALVTALAYALERRAKTTRTDVGRPSAEAQALQIIATASHEMRTHLAAIASASQLMLEQSTSTTENARTIAKSAETLIEIATNTLNLARLDKEQTRLSFAPFDLRQLVQDVIDVERSTAEAKGLTLGLDYAEDLPRRVVGSAGPLYQIIANLVSNAIKFTASGRVTIRVSGIAAAGKAHVQIAVEDTGPGIAPADQSRIFDSFVQIDQPRGESLGGLGLGLAISQRLANLMGTKINVDSRPGIGSTFSLALDLPIDRRDAESRDAPIPTPLVLPRRILIADDVETNRRLVAAMLADPGCEIRLAANGEEAVAAALAFEPEVILMDVSMPDLDGYEVTRRIRAAESEAHRAVTPIIALTAHAMRGDKDRCLAAGMDDYVTKPIRKAALREIVGKWGAVKKGAPRPSTSYQGPERRARALAS